MVECLYEPWPEAPCPVCKEPAGVWYYDDAAKQTVLEHADAEREPCRAEGGAPFWQGEGISLRFSFDDGQHFRTLDEALDWGRFCLGYDGDQSKRHFGYVRLPSRHREIGLVRRSEDALATVTRDTAPAPA